MNGLNDEREMAVLQAGVAKSGNYWLYNIIEQLLDRGSVPEASFIRQQPIYEEAQEWKLSYQDQAGIDVLYVEDDGCSYGIANTFRQPVADLEAYVSQCRHVWTHSRWSTQTMQVLRAFDHVVYIVRDPRDVLISKSKFAFSEYARTYHLADPGESPQAFLENRLYGSMLRWVNHVGEYLRHRREGRVHFVFYERLLHDFDREVAALVDHLDLDVDADAIAEVRGAVHYSTLKKKDPKHVRKGKSRQWVDVLTPEQKAAAVKVTGPMLELLGYPLDDEDGGLPSVPASLTHEQVEAAIEHARGGPLDKLKYAYTLLTSSRSLREKLRKGWEFMTRR